MLAGVLSIVKFECLLGIILDLFVSLFGINKKYNFLDRQK